MLILKREEYDRLLHIHSVIRRAFYITLSNVENEDAWRALFKFVFREDVAGKIFDIVPDFDWDDPDTTYQEDVCAFINAFNKLIDEIEVISEV